MDDRKYKIANDWSQLTNKGYELLIYPNGDKVYLLDGQYHRENAPAIIFMNGYQAWFIHYKLHNLNGPAVIWGDIKEYFIDDKYYKKNEFWTIQKKCFKCHQEFHNLYDLKVHLEQYDDSNGKDMINYIFKLFLG